MHAAQNLYNDVAKQGCNVFLAPSAGAGNTVDWVSMHSSTHYLEAAGVHNAMQSKAPVLGLCPRACPLKMSRVGGLDHTGLPIGPGLVNGRAAQVSCKALTFCCACTVFSS